MSSNGVNFNAPKDTTAVRKFDMKALQKAAGAGATAGIIGSIFTMAKINNAGNTGEAKYGGTADYSGTVHYESDVPYEVADTYSGTVAGTVTGEVPYEGDVTVTGKEPEKTE